MLRRKEVSPPIAIHSQPPKNDSFVGLFARGMIVNAAPHPVMCPCSLVKVALRPASISSPGSAWRKGQKAARRTK